MKIKVLYILNRAIMGGATISFLNMIEGLAAYGVEPIVVIPRNDHHGEELLRYLQEHHITFYQTTLTATSLHKPTSILHFLRICLSGLLMYLRKVSSYFELQKIVRKEKPDIIHTNVGIIREGLTVARKAGIPHILHIREYQNKDTFKKELRTLCPSFRCHHHDYRRPAFLFPSTGHAEGQNYI